MNKTTFSSLMRASDAEGYAQRLDKLVATAPNVPPGIMERLQSKAAEDEAESGDPEVFVASLAAGIAEWQFDYAEAMLDRREEMKRLYVENLGSVELELTRPPIVGKRIDPAT